EGEQGGGARGAGLKSRPSPSRVTRRGRRDRCGTKPRERDKHRSEGRSESPTRNPGLKPLDKLVGTWKASGETTGELSYEWMEGGFFLIARGDTEQNGQRTKHVEIIG